MKSGFYITWEQNDRGIKEGYHWADYADFERSGYTAEEMKELKRSSGFQEYQGEFVGLDKPEPPEIPEPVKSNRLDSVLTTRFRDRGIKPLLHLPDVGINPSLIDAAGQFQKPGSLFRQWRGHLGDMIPYNPAVFPSASLQV